MSFGTACSMLLGFARDILLAFFFGTSALLDAFIVAFRLPNLFRSIFGEGFSDTVATPILSEYQHDRKKLFAVGQNMLSLSVIILFFATIIGIIWARWLVIAIVPGFLSQPETFAMAVSFTRITFLYLFFIGLSVNSFAILYTLKKFFVPAITPAFLNVSFIIGLIFFNELFKEYILVLCVISGGALQLLIPFLALRREKFYFRFRIKGIFADKALLRMLKLFPPRIASSIVYQLSVIVDNIFASFGTIVGAGAVSAMWYAQRYIHMPIALIVISLCRVSMVDLSYSHSRDNFVDFKKLIVFSFQNIIFFIVPITITYMVMSDIIVDLVYQRGDFGAYSVYMTAVILFFYSFGLFFFCGIKVLVNAFYALKDTMLPAKVCAISLLVNALLSALLMYPLRIGGVALGSSLAAIFNFFILYHFLIKRIGPIDWQDTKSQFYKVLALSLVTVLSSYFLWQLLIGSKYLKAGVVCVWAVGIFSGLGIILRLKQINYARQWIFAKK